MSSTQLESQTVPEGRDCRWRGQFGDDDGTALTEAQTLTILLTLINLESGTVVRNAVNIDGALGGSWSSDVFTLIIDSADIAITNRNKPFNRFMAQIEWTWDRGGGSTGNSSAYVFIHVKNLRYR